MIQEKVMFLLEKKQGETISGGYMARALNVSRTAVWKAVHLLIEKGNDIEIVPNSGYRLNSAGDRLSVPAVQQYLRTGSFGRSLEILEVTDSTMNYIRRMDVSEKDEGFCVISNEQTGGKGRLQRHFYSPPNEGIYMSFLLKPRIRLSETPFLTICAAAAVSRAIDKICGVNTQIKWVNDVYCGGKKICGILTEAALSAEIGSIDYAVTGIGVNTGQIPEEISSTAASVFEQTGLKGIRCRLAAEILNEFEDIYFGFTMYDQKKEILNEYESKLFILGRQVQVDALDRRYNAVVLGINDDAELLVECEDKTRHTINSGEINLI